MAKTMEPLLELPISLPPSGSRQLLRAVYGQMRAAIVGGCLQPGTRLPSTRAFAAAVGVSRNTAVAAYDLLLSEGYLIVRPGAGAYVADVSCRSRRPAPGDPLPPDGRLNELWREPRTVPPATTSTSCRFDFFRSV